MTTEIIETTCRICAKPMRLILPGDCNAGVMTKLVKIIICDSCASNEAEAAKPQTKREVRLPYADS